MKSGFLVLAAGLGALIAAGSTQLASAQGEKGSVERLYILNCGEGAAGDISRWSPGVNVGKSMDFVDGCYLIKHGQVWLLCDTALADAIAAVLAGQSPADPGIDHRPRPTPLAAELDCSA